MLQAAMCLLGVCEGHNTLNVIEIARKLIKSWPCCRSVGHCFSVTLFSATIVGQMVKISPPPPVENVLAHPWLQDRKMLNSKDFVVLAVKGKMRQEIIFLSSL